MALYVRRILPEGFRPTLKGEAGYKQRQYVNPVTGERLSYRQGNALAHTEYVEIKTKKEVAEQKKNLSESNKHLRQEPVTTQNKSIEVKKQKIELKRVENITGRYKSNPVYYTARDLYATSHDLTPTQAGRNFEFKILYKELFGAIKEYTKTNHSMKGALNDKRITEALINMEIPKDEWGFIYQ